MKLKQILAILGIVILVLLYVSTLVFALIGTPFAKQALLASLFATVLIPILIYAFLLVTKLLRKKEEDMED